MIRDASQATHLNGRFSWTSDAIGVKLREKLDKEYTPGEVDGEARVLRRLGLLPMGVEYGKLLVDLLMEQVAGFYDPASRRLYIADWLPMEMQRPALAHEIQHALHVPVERGGLLALLAELIVRDPARV